MRRPSIALIVSAIVLGSGIAGAATPPSRGEVIVEAMRGRGVEGSQSVVRFADLSLASPAGQRALVRRVDFAIGSLCDGMRVTDPVGTVECHKVAWDSVRGQLAQVMPTR
jgi:UrcA family protein